MLTDSMPSRSARAPAADTTRLLVSCARRSALASPSAAIFIPPTLGLVRVLAMSPRRPPLDTLPCTVYPYYVMVILTLYGLRTSVGDLGMSLVSFSRVAPRPGARPVRSVAARAMRGVAHGFE